MGGLILKAMRQFYIFCFNMSIPKILFLLCC